VNSELMVSTPGILQARAENFKGGGNKYSEEFPHYSSEQGTEGICNGVSPLYALVRALVG